jgi:hypothetical protein
MIREHIMCVGYECSDCGECFEFPMDAFGHQRWCNKQWYLDNKEKAKKQMAQIQLHTFKPDGSHAGIALSEPEPIIIAADLVELRSSVKKLIGNW